MSSFFNSLVSYLVLLSVVGIAQDSGQLLSNTDYDWAYGNSPNHQIVMINLDNDGNLDPVIINLYRNNSTSTPRYVAIHYKIGNTWNSIQPFTNSGTISLNYCDSGPLAGKLLAHSGNNISVIDPVNWQYNTYQTNLAYILALAYVPDGTMYATSELTIYKSIDQGVTFNPHIIIGAGDPTVNLSAFSGPSEVILKTSENGQYISFVGCFAEGAINGTDDIVYYYYSTDFGATWQGKIIGVDGIYGQVVNRNFAPQFENFGQLTFEIDNLGVTHIVINGYGKGVLAGSSDTTDVFPVLYWNSKDENWIAITDESLEYPTDGFGNVLSNLRAGNGIGNAFPTLSITPDGNGVVILYQSVEHVSGMGSQFNIYPGDSGPSSIPVAYTNLFANISDNAGQSWYFQFFPLTYDNNKMEQYPICFSMIEDLGFPFLFKVHYLYQYDSIPGVSVLGQNSENSNGGWYYNNYFFQFTDVKEDNQVVNNFQLFQNYPNPFNPSTTIKFALPIKTNLSLNVYNTLGEKVSEIFNGELEEGYHEMLFNASGLSSGIYFYKIESENYTATKKLMLLK